MSPHPSRRTFIAMSTLAAAASLTRAAGPAPSRKLVVGIMGLRRGAALIKSILEIPNVEIAYVIDVDQTCVAKAQQLITKAGSASRPKGVQDFRRVLDDRHVDALFVATPNFWHTPASILACAAGKHVYVEKPGSHNARESQWIVAAARKHKRVVQMGNQRRSWPVIIEAMNRLRQGVIGRVLAARTWYANSRVSIGRGKPVPVPAHLDYSLWQGPAPERPYVDNLVHYNWHWRWHWGNGEMGNNGVHALDLARWGLGVDAPRSVTYAGGRYHFDDDQETPDTGVATFDFGHCLATWECSSCHPRATDQLDIVRFYGDKGMLAIVGTAAKVMEPQYKIFDLQGKEVESKAGPGTDRMHIENFLDCIREEKTPTSEIEEGQKTALMCHLANISYRVGRTVRYDAEKRQIVGDAEAMRMWGRDYRKGWEPVV